MNISIHLAVIRASFIMYGLNTAPCRDERLPLFIKALKINAPLSLKSQRIITIQILQHILQVCDTLHDPILCKPLYLFTFFPFLRMCNILMPLFHQRIKPRSCLGPLIVGSLGKNGKKIDQWGGRQNRYEGLGLTTDRPQDAPGGSRLSPTGLGLKTD